MYLGPQRTMQSSQLNVTDYHHSLIRLVQQGRRAVYILQRGPRPAFASRLAAHLGWGARPDHELFLVLHGLLGELVAES